MGTWMMMARHLVENLYAMHFAYAFHVPGWKTKIHYVSSAICCADDVSRWRYNASTNAIYTTLNFCSTFFGFGWTKRHRKRENRMRIYFCLFGGKQCADSETFDLGCFVWYARKYLMRVLRIVANISHCFGLVVWERRRGGWAHNSKW